VEIRFVDLQTGELSFLFSVFDASGDPANGADSATPFDFTVVPTAFPDGSLDLSIRKDDGAESIRPGGLLSFTLTYRNNSDVGVRRNRP